MSSRPLRPSSRSRYRLLAAAAVAVAGGTAWLVRSKRPQPPEPAAAPPRIGYTRHGAAVASDGDPEATAD
ncbi:hypothetical protein NLM24_06175 [Nocardia zapadnayensis]|uniref:hypothetical protein n=1 Tax=Nocardia rhamnosiphila TaxID=426716 RepID=UPI0022484F3F|nr:hypothetical protein [Nocardia zapadnayensis]MCX0270298.1 hypothetical protein [Nocardia zapadnayensis]